MVANLFHVLLAQGLLAVGGIDCHAQSERLIDEIIAGCDKNVALIDQGRFRYRYSVWSDRKQDDAQRRDFDAQVYLKGKKTRRDMAHERLVMDGEKVISFDTRYLNRAELSPRHLVTTIETATQSPQILIDPRLSGSAAVVGGIGQIFRAQRDLPEDAPKSEIAVSHDGNLVKVVILVPSAFHRADYWISPSHGYGIVRQRLWALKTQESPYQEVDSEFRQLANGAFIVARQTQIRRVSDREMLRDAARREIVLIDCDVESLVPDDVFTLAGLRLPKGSRVYDRIHGNEYIYEGDP